MSKFKKSYCNDLIEHMAQGLSFASFGATLTPRVCRAQLYNWLKIHPEFAKAKEIAWTASLLYWEKFGIAGTGGKIKGFNCVSWIFNMKNRFPKDWKDRHNIAMTNDDKKNYDTLSPSERKEFLKDPKNVKLLEKVRAEVAKAKSRKSK